MGRHLQFAVWLGGNVTIIINILDDLSPSSL